MTLKNSRSSFRLLMILVSNMHAYIIDDCMVLIATDVPADSLDSINFAGANA
jgi:hypothetical protein